ncbi:MAG: hypothetical protein ACRDPM_09425, partial [Solirubrobacteraceae bacterium]
MGTDERLVTLPFALGLKPLSVEGVALEPVLEADGGGLPAGVSSSGCSWKLAVGVKLSSTGWPATVPVTWAFM